MSIQHKRGEVINEGKTKKIYSTPGFPDIAIVESKDTITRFDAKVAKDKAEMPGKGALANRTTCNIFRLLKSYNVPVAYIDQLDSSSFLAHRCRMLPIEVVVRREAHGSYLKRTLDLPRGFRFQKLKVEFYLKTKGGKWKDYHLPDGEDDPYMVLQGNTILLYHPAKPFFVQKPLAIPVSDVFTTSDDAKYFPVMEDIAKKTFRILELAFWRLGYRYVDMKVEFGFDRPGNLLLADSIDNDSGRLLDKEGRYMDKQYWRDGGSLDNMKKLMELVAGLTDQFGKIGRR